MKTPRSEPEYICDTSRMRPTPPHSPLHWLFAVLLMDLMTPYIDRITGRRPLFAEGGKADE